MLKGFRFGAEIGIYKWVLELRLWLSFQLLIEKAGGLGFEAR